MLKKFVIFAFVSFFVALAVSMTAAYFIQTNDVDALTNKELRQLLDDVDGLIASNDEQVRQIREEMDAQYLAKTRAVAEMLKLKPEILTDYEELCRIRDLIGIDEIHVTDADGILKWGTVKEYFGTDFSSSEQTLPFYQGIGNPDFELAQDPQPNATMDVQFQYIGVSRYDGEDGVVQIGMHPTRLEEALDKAAPENLLTQLKTEASMRLILLDGETIVGDSKQTLNGKSLGDAATGTLKAGSGNITLDSEDGHYVAGNSGSYLVAAIANKAGMYRSRNNMLVIFLITNSLVLFFLILVVGLWLKRGIVNPIIRIEDAISHVAGGDLGYQFSERGMPEFVSLSGHVNTTVGSMRKMLDESREMTRALTSVIESVESGTRNIEAIIGDLSMESHNLQAEATSQDQVAETMAQLFMEVRKNAMSNLKHASSASEAALTALNDANDGSGRMADVVTAVKAIDGASKDISEIIKVIDDIAFQTNMLALNAAVEAERAGQHGKGFAVVAEEVRSLANKSAEAAKQTNLLISTSIQRAHSGVQIANETAEGISLIVDKIKESSAYMEKIVGSSKEQVNSVECFNESVTGIRRSTKGIEQSSEHILRNSQLLQANTRDVSGVIGNVRLLPSESAKTTPALTSGKRR